MSEQAEFNRGYFGGQRNNDASRAGANTAIWEQQAQERREASQRAAALPQISKPLLPPDMIGASSAGTHTGSVGAPATFFGAVKGGAAGSVVLFLLVVFFGGAPWAAPQFLAWGLTWALVGALAGGAIFAGLVVLGVALRMIGWLLVAGIALHLFGAIDLFAVIGRLIRTL